MLQISFVARKIFGADVDFVRTFLTIFDKSLDTCPKIRKVP